MIATRAEILVWLKRTSQLSDADLAVVDMVHSWSERAVLDYLDYNPVYQLQTEYLPISDGIDCPYDMNSYDMVNNRVVSLSRYPRIRRLRF